MTFRFKLPDNKFISDAWSYGVDAVQRSVLFWNVLRKRGNNYLALCANGQPPVLVFDYETIIDGKELDRPVNYSLVQIIDRRGTKMDRRARKKKPTGEGADKRGTEPDRREQPKGLIGKEYESERPILLIDPRAGQGPGIGGSKLDSQIGMALNAGHPVYFLLFSTWPQPGQTLEDVWRAEIRFIEAIRQRHPEAPKPAVIGNCQGGWAAALIGAERPDITGPMAFNGSPLSYWGGVDGVNPMRYTGGLIGGAWVNAFLSDLGNGYFDGANLVANFENLNPANTLWTKLYAVYANVDTEEERFLKFEKWWSGFYFMTGDEITTIVKGLFIGNQLEQGQFQIEEGKELNLRNFKEPVVLFTSFGDNITPPQQALNWVAKVYGSSREIKRKGRVIVMVMHESIGHLGIFVSAKIARKEHKEIIGSFDMLEFLPPGLYEMIIEGDAPITKDHTYSVRFAERHVDDILSYDDGLEDEKAFYTVRAVSEMNDFVYRTAVRPLIQQMTTDFSAEWLRQLHPLRVQRYALSDLNPLTWPLKVIAPEVKKKRQPASDENLFCVMEQTFSNNMVTMLNAYRDARDISQEMLFKAIYGHPWVELLYSPPYGEEEKNRTQMEEKLQRDAEILYSCMEKGATPEAIVRILLAIMTADQELTRDEYTTLETAIQAYDQLKHFSSVKLRETIKAQSRLLQVDREESLKTLLKLIPNENDRDAVVEVIDNYTQAIKRPLKPEESRVITEIERMLKGRHNDHQ